MIHADYLFLLTDVDGLYTSNPRKDPTAKQIQVVNSISAIREEGKFLPTKLIWETLADIDYTVSTTTLGSSLGTGGMETKLIAAEIATAAGVTTIITSSKQPEIIFSIIEYHTLNTTRSTPTPVIPLATLSGRINSLSKTSVEPSAPGESLSPQTLNRPPHTVFTASATPMRDLKSWTSHTLFPSGSVIIDAGAHQVLSKRESGGRLFAAGVVGTIGAFASGQAVRIVIRKKAGKETEDAERTAYANALGTRPNTPTQETVSGYVTPLELSSEEEGIELSKSARVPSHVNEIAEADVVEVGRGLANYNSAQLNHVKGLNRSVRSSSVVECS